MRHCSQVWTLDVVDLVSSFMLIVLILWNQIFFGTSCSFADEKYCKHSYSSGSE